MKGIISLRNIIFVIVLVSISQLMAFPSISNMFKMNKQLQEEGYYMAEFEFKMLGIVYNLDRGHYIKGYRQLSKLNRQMKTREGLIKVPEFKNKEEELEFYLNLQNPKTGAFMDDSYPFCTWTGPTGNVLIHLDELARVTGQPLKLKYPLRFLDNINTPEKLEAYLNDAATIGRIGNKFPQTSFHFTRDLLSLYYEDNTITKNNLYIMSPEWNEALLRWFYEHQDSKSGVWGPMNKKGRLVRKDTQNTASILKSFIDENGNNVHKDFPLRYRDELASTILSEFSFELPDDNDFVEWHEWNLNTSKSVRMLFRCLWNDVSAENREKTKTMMKHYIDVKFKKFYVKKDGAFSYYPFADQASLDGSGGVITVFKEIGAFSGSKFTNTWGDSIQANIFTKDYTMNELRKEDFVQLIKQKQVNSFRIYNVTPDSNQYSKGVNCVYYPEEPVVLDVMDFIPKIKFWVDQTNLSMGNWTSKEDIQNNVYQTEINEVPVFVTTLPTDNLNSLFETNSSVTMIGFDELQMPVCKLIIKK